MKAGIWSRLAWLGTLAAAASVGAQDGMKVDYKPLQFGAVQEFGVVRRALMVSKGDLVLKNEWIDHFGSFLTQEAVVNDRLALRIGLGGVFQFPKPEEISEAFGGSQYKMFFIGPSVAEARYHFGGVENSTFSLGGGLFPYKYNPDAANLGEYLFRSGPYPTYLQTGGLTVIGDNAAYLQGFRGDAELGNLGLSMFLITETGMPPLYDWSLAFVADYKLADGLIELGAGANFKRLIPVDAEKSVRKEAENSYVTRGGGTFVGDPTYYRKRASFWSNIKLNKAVTPADSAFALAQAQYYTDYADSVSKNTTEGGWRDPATGLIPGAEYYTPAGPMFMGRLSLDLKKIFPSDRLSAQDFRLFTEVGLLGWTNYPVFYEKRADRVPVMVGFNLPTWGLLDLVSLQFEYFNSPNLNNTYQLGYRNYATAVQPEGTLSHFSGDEYNDITKKDNYSWNILVQKRILSALSINAQFARDHMRTVGTNWFYGGRLEPMEILSRSSDWYGMLQIAWNL